MSIQKSDGDPTHARRRRTLARPPLARGEDVTVSEDPRHAADRDRARVSATSMWSTATTPTWSVPRPNGRAPGRFRLVPRALRTPGSLVERDAQKYWGVLPRGSAAAGAGRGVRGASSSGGWTCATAEARHVGRLGPAGRELRATGDRLCGRPVRRPTSTRPPPSNRIGRGEAPGDPVCSGPQEKGGARHRGRPARRSPRRRRVRWMAVGRRPP
jgi:hypothetical protein